MKDTNLVNALREHAEWAEGNQWETPITLGDDLAEAADVIERLSAQLKSYKDTGLEPAMCANYKTFEDEAISKGVPFKRIVALMEADRAGRLVVLPCKVGDKLYRVFYGEIFEHRVGSMKYFAIQGKWDIETYPFCPCVESSIGKTIFLTREEAEKALEAMKDE